MVKHVNIERQCTLYSIHTADIRLNVTNYRYLMMEFISNIFSSKKLIINYDYQYFSSFPARKMHCFRSLTLVIIEDRMGSFASIKPFQYYSKTSC